LTTLSPRSSGFVRARSSREHKLKNVDVDIPRDSLVVFSGISGSGKSSLALATIYAEAQRRYFESVAPYARRGPTNAVGRIFVDYQPGATNVVVLTNLIAKSLAKPKSGNGVDGALRNAAVTVNKAVAKTATTARRRV
jgi:energy-coupling factor transporter ATP-binding protein EcfA2